MREIKFRAWDKKYNQMVSWDDISKNNIIGSLINNNNRSISNGVLMQFTGLLDKNGVEIYEGDILLYPDSFNSKGKVVFENGGFCANGQECYIQYLSFKKCEVIGNIYEHTHLLGGE